MNSLTSSQFETKTGKGNVVIDFFAEWCGPCKMLSPIFEDLAKTSEDVKFFKINVDDEAMLASDMGVMSIPTLVFMKNGEEVDRHVGMISKENLKTRMSRIF